MAFAPAEAPSGDAREPLLEHVVVEFERARVGAPRGDAAGVGVEVDGLAEEGRHVAVPRQFFTQ